MKNLIKRYSLSILALAMLFAPSLLYSTASAASGCAVSQSKSATVDPLATGANLGDANGPVNCDKTGVDNSNITTLAQNVVNIFSIIVGAVSVIMIIYGGFRYITSGGDSGRVGNAKNTLIYAVIGLVIVALAQLIVHFVIAQSTSVSTGA